MNRTYSRLPWLLLFALALTASSFGQITRVGSAYVFRVKFPKEAPLRYQTIVTTSLSQTKVAFTIPLVETVVGTHHDITDLVVKSGPLSVNGKSAMPATVSRMSVNRRGLLVAGSAASGGGMSNSGITVFPADPMRPGQTWRATVPLPLGGINTESATVTTNYKFVRMTSYKGKRVAQLSLTFFNPGAQFKIRGSGTAYVLASDGNMFESQMKVQVEVSQDMQPVNVNVEVHRA